MRYTKDNPPAELAQITTIATPNVEGYMYSRVIWGWWGDPKVGKEEEARRLDAGLIFSEDKYGYLEACAELLKINGYTVTPPTTNQ